MTAYPSQVPWFDSPSPISPVGAGVADPMKQLVLTLMFGARRCFSQSPYAAVSHVT
jgi:hypothetical protein